jgi:T5orf172 domain
VIYFVREGTDGHIKIGYAASVRKRLRTIQTGNPRPLTVLASVQGGYRHERFLQRRFKHLRIRGEWFRPDSELLHYIYSEDLLARLRREYEEHFPQPTVADAKVPMSGDSTDPSECF